MIQHAALIIVAPSAPIRMRIKGCIQLGFRRDPRFIVS